MCGEKNLNSVFVFNEKGKQKGEYYTFGAGVGSAGGSDASLAQLAFLCGPDWPGGLPHHCKGSQPGFTTVVASVIRFGNTGHP